MLLLFSAVWFGVAVFVQETHGRVSNYASTSNNHNNLNENEYISEDQQQQSYAKDDEISLTNDNQNSGNQFGEQNVPGDLHPDYPPTYTEIPRTGFSCRGKVNWRYYADIDTNCQVFHICESEYTKISFICPIGSVFNQRHLVCDWWYNVDCNEAESLYTLSNDDEFNESEHLGSIEDESGGGSRNDNDRS